MYWMLLCFGFWCLFVPSLLPLAYHSIIRDSWRYSLTFGRFSLKVRFILPLLAPRWYRWRCRLALWAAIGCCGECRGRRHRYFLASRAYVARNFLRFSLIHTNAWPVVPFVACIATDHKHVDCGVVGSSAKAIYLTSCLRWGIAGRRYSTVDGRRWAFRLVEKYG